VLVIKIDHVHPQPAQARVARAAHVGGRAADAPFHRIVRIEHNPEFRCQDNLLAAALDGFANEFFIDPRSIHIRCVEQRDAEIERAMDGGHGFRVVAFPVKRAHAHAAEAQCRNGQSLCPQFSLLHIHTPLCVSILSFPDA
jgi:hypothetical protein